MRTFAFGTLALGLFILAASASAQPGIGGGRQGGGASATQLLQMKEVREELKVTDEQVEKIQKEAKAVQEKIREKFGDLKDLSKEERQAKFGEIMKATTEESKKVIEGVLTSEQTKRLNQLVLQRGGVTAAIRNPEVAEKLGITDEQKEKAKSISEEFQGEMRELFKSGKEGFAKLPALTKEMNEKLAGVLTEEQKKKWDDMVGPKFEFPAFNPMRRPGGNKQID